METRIQDKKCENCAAYNSIFGRCNSNKSKNYQNSVKTNDSCNNFRPKNVCLECYNYRSDFKSCGNNKSPYYDQFVYDKYLKYCPYRYNNGYVASMISDILNLNKKKSYNLLLYKLKKELLNINDKYKKYISFYDEFGPLFANSLKNDSNSLDYAKYLKESYLEATFFYLLNEDYLSSFSSFKAMLEDMNNNYHIVDEDYYKLIKKF